MKVLGLMKHKVTRQPEKTPSKQPKNSMSCHIKICRWKILKYKPSDENIPVAKIITRQLFVILSDKGKEPSCKKMNCWNIWTSLHFLSKFEKFAAEQCQCQGTAGAFWVQFIHLSWRALMPLCLCTSKCHPWRCKSGGINLFLFLIRPSYLTAACYCQS